MQTTKTHNEIYNLDSPISTFLPLTSEDTIPHEQICKSSQQNVSNLILAIHMCICVYVYLYVFIDKDNLL